MMIDRWKVTFYVSFNKSGHTFSASNFTKGSVAASRRSETMRMIRKLRFKNKLHNDPKSLLDYFIPRRANP